MAAYFTTTGGSPVTIPRSVRLVTGSTQIEPTDYYIGCNGTGIILTLPPGVGVVAGKSYIIKDESGLAATNHITVNGSGGNLIDGNSSLTIVVNYLSLGLLWTGTKWSII